VESQLLIDEQLSPQIAARLGDKGYDVEAVVDRADLVGSQTGRSSSWRLEKAGRW